MFIMCQDCVEHHFSRVKRAAGANPTIKGACLSTQRLHLQQLRKVKGIHGTQNQPAKKNRFWSGVDSETATKLGGQALNAAATLFALADIGVHPEKVKEEFTGWFKSVGMSLLLRFDAETECGSEPESDESGNERATGPPEARWPCDAMCFLCFFHVGS